MQPYPAEVFEELRTAIAAGDVEATLDQLIERLRRDARNHELFDSLLMRGRVRLGLPIVLSGSLDELPEPLRSQVETAYLDACREVGMALLGAGQLREAWMYLRPLGPNAAVVQALEQVEVTDDNLQDLVGIALHEGAAVALGYRLVLERFGTCNAITMFESVIAGRPRADQQVAAALLVRHLHGELMANLRRDLEARHGKPPVGDTLAELVADEDSLFGEYTYHTDTTHLVSAVRAARVLEDRETIRVAIDLTDYGRRLNSQFQHPSEEPFKDTYPSHGLFLRARLDEDVDAALAYFCQRAEELPIEEVGPLPAEVYISLLAQAKRFDDAIEASARLLPPGVPTTGVVPSLMELSGRAGRFEQLLRTSQDRGDVVGFAAGLIAERLAAHPVVESRR